MAIWVTFDEFYGHLFEHITNGERPPIDEEEPADEETVLDLSPGQQETHPTSGRRITGKTQTSGEDPDQMRCQEPRVVNGDGQRPRVENKIAPGDTTDTTEDVDPEVKRRVTDAPVQVQPQVQGGIVYPPGLLLPQETSSAPVRGSGWPGSVNQNDEDMSELVLVLLAQGKKKRELDLKDPRWQTKEGKQLAAERYWKEMESLVKDTKACVPVSLEKSRLLRSSVPDRILQPRPVPTLRTKGGGLRG